MQSRQLLAPPDVAAPLLLTPPATPRRQLSSITAPPEAFSDRDGEGYGTGKPGCPALERLGRQARHQPGRRRLQEQLRGRAELAHPVRHQPARVVGAQVWSRDPLSSFGSSLSDGLQFVINP